MLVSFTGQTAEATLGDLRLFLLTTEDKDEPKPRKVKAAPVSDFLPTSEEDLLAA